MRKGETPLVWHMRFEVRVLDVAIADAAQLAPQAAGPIPYVLIPASQVLRSIYPPAVPDHLVLTTEGAQTAVQHGERTAG